jgi:predicted ATP-dependent endonuclease of OLD family
VRKYFESSTPNRVRSNQSNIYGYENGAISDNLFYGARNISGAKLGDVIYIPEVTKTDEYTKLSGPSALRNLLEFVVEKVVNDSSAFRDLSRPFEEFNKEFREEASKDGFSVKSLIDDINREIREWDTTFGIDINRIKPQEIIKSLVSHYLVDKNLEGKMDISNLGQGFQRYIIYILIRLSTKYKDIPVKREKKEFAPDFTMILFEEPEVFLHPAQQEALNMSLKEISSEDSRQVMISTHSSHFTSKNIDDIQSILKLAKNGPETIVHQVDESTLQRVLEENEELKKILGKAKTDKDIELGSIRYCLWLDPDRCCAFFANTVLICEGLSEKALIDTLIKNRRIKFQSSNTYILSASGKRDIHRYMNLFGKLGIKHSVLFDRDKDTEEHQKINQFIEKNKNAFTLGCYSFPNEFEDFLEIAKETDGYKKPLNVMWHYQNGKIKDETIDALGEIVKALIDT